MVKLVILLAELLAAKVKHDVDQHAVKRNFMYFFLFSAGEREREI